MTTKKSTKTAKTSKAEPKTMADLLSAYGKTPLDLERGQVIEGKVVEITNKRVLIDIGGKSEGIIAEKAFIQAKGYIKTLKVGDTVKAGVIVPENPDGRTILSLRNSASEALWKKLEKAHDEGTPLPVFGKIVRPSGVLVDVESLTGFIPSSQLSPEYTKDPNKLNSKHFKAVVIDLDRKENKLVLSQRLADSSGDLKAKNAAIKNLSSTKVYTGTVTTITDFGIFVNISVGAGKSKVEVEGLVHVSEISYEKVDSPGSLFKKGDKVKVKVLSKEIGKLALSIKATQKDPWDTIGKKLKKDDKVKGKVTRRSEFGTFVRVAPGIEGLIHMTKIPPGHSLNEGDEINVFIEEVDTKKKKISLGLVLTTKPVGYK